MKTIVLPDSSLQVSEFCYGAGGLGSKTKGHEVDRILNSFRDAGGNFIDTAHCYAAWAPEGSGCSERAIAEYIRRNGGKDELIVATKGCHPGFGKYERPDAYLSPEVLASDIDDSLERLNRETIDLYWLHRDDPRLTVDEIMDFVHEEIQKGRIRHIAASNWTSERLDAANTYADKKGIPGFVASQPQWSLAHVDNPPATTVFAGPEDIAWHTESKLPVIPWSPTARGFFATGKPDKQCDNPESLKRLERARKLADELDASPVQIALAWLRGHDFPVIPILGTSKPDHLQEAIASRNISLTPSQRDALTVGE